MTKKRLFIGRETELKRLRSMLDKKSASFLAIKGRRRVGKSRLVDEFSKNFKYYYKFEGLAPSKEITSAKQIEEFNKQFSKQFNAPNPKFDDWSDVFWAVGDKVQSGSILLFFDELSWMGSKSTTFLSKLKKAWDNNYSVNPELVFIVCSSASSWLEKNLLSSTAFVGRISHTITLDQLPLSDCDKFWQKGISAYEKFKVLSITGGIPKYLEEINPKLSAEENIRQLCFTKGALLVKEFNRIFSDLFMRESQFYEKIVSYLATGQKNQRQIQNEFNKTQGENQYGRVSEYLWELEESGFIQRDYTWHIHNGEDSKLSVYRLSDNYLRFYLKYIKKNFHRIERNAYNLKSLSSLQEWKSIMGLQFENLVLNNRKVLHEKLNISPDEIINDNPFFQRKTSRLAGCQIDYLIQTKFNTLYICEVKFSSNEVDISIIKELEEKISRLKVPAGFSYRPVLIHVNGVSEAVTDADYFSNIINFGDLL